MNPLAIGNSSDFFSTWVSGERSRTIHLLRFNRLLWLPRERLPRALGSCKAKS